MKRTILILALLALYVLAGCGTIRRAKPSSFTAEAHNGAVTVVGTVADSWNRQPIAGAIVERIGSKNFAVADSTGRYSIEAAVGDTLRFSCIGYRWQLHKVIRERLDIRLNGQDETLIEEEDPIMIEWSPPIMDIPMGIPRRNVEEKLRRQRGE
ncbi:MAG: carboxypeptidase-like regulatory domain-containing protein [Bacteroidales bacterium]|nr:carboxypeptidase-like regulatory domain-containing protein [Bacteroidales bacterium]